MHVLGGEHLGGKSPEGVVWHSAPRDSRDAYIPGSLLIVPVRIASGVRMKILEAWARGIPVLATPEAAAGLDATDGRELLLFRDAPGLIDALRRLRDNPRLIEEMELAGRSRLVREHEPGRVARDLLRHYRRGRLSR